MPLGSSDYVGGAPSKETPIHDMSLGFNSGEQPDLMKILPVGTWNSLFSRSIFFSNPYEEGRRLGFASNPSLRQRLLKDFHDVYPSHDFFKYYVLWRNRHFLKKIVFIIAVIPITLINLFLLPEFLVAGIRSCLRHLLIKAKININSEKLRLQIPAYEEDVLDDSTSGMQKTAEDEAVETSTMAANSPRENRSTVDTDTSTVLPLIRLSMKQTGCFLFLYLPYLFFSFLLKTLRLVTSPIEAAKRAWAKHPLLGVISIGLSFVTCILGHFFTGPMIIKTIGLDILPSIYPLFTSLAHMLSVVFFKKLKTSFRNKILQSASLEKNTSGSMLTKVGKYSPSQVPFSPPPSSPPPPDFPPVLF